MNDTSKKTDSLDNYGRLTDHWSENAPMYDAKKIRDYCRKHNKSASEMTFEEFEQFRSDK